MKNDIKYVVACMACMAVAGIFVISQSLFVTANHDSIQAAPSISLQAKTLAAETVARQTVETLEAERRPELINAFMTNFSGGTVPLSEATGEVREFTLEVTQVVREIAPKVEVEQWAFHFPGEEPTVPGPEIRVKQGDLVRITLRNTHSQPHSIHPHGITSLAMEMDGVEAIEEPIQEIDSRLTTITTVLQGLGTNINGVQSSVAKTQRRIRLFTILGTLALSLLSLWTSWANLALFKNGRRSFRKPSSS